MVYFSFDEHQISSVAIGGGDIAAVASSLVASLPGGEMTVNRADTLRASLNGILERLFIHFQVSL